MATLNALNCFLLQLASMVAQSSLAAFDLKLFQPMAVQFQSNNVSTISASSSLDCSSKCQSRGSSCVAYSFDAASNKCNLGAVISYVSVSPSNNDNILVIQNSSAQCLIMPISANASSIYYIGNDSYDPSRLYNGVLTTGLAACNAKTGPKLSWFVFDFGADVCVDSAVFTHRKSNSDQFQNLRLSVGDFTPTSEDASDNRLFTENALCSFVASSPSDEATTVFKCSSRLTGRYGLLQQTVWTGPSSTGLAGYELQFYCHCSHPSLVNRAVNQQQNEET